MFKHWSGINLEFNLRRYVMKRTRKWGTISVIIIALVASVLAPQVTPQIASAVGPPDDGVDTVVVHTGDGSFTAEQQSIWGPGQSPSG